MKNLYLTFLSLITLNATAQTTFERVKTIFDNNCTTGCHSGASPDGQLNLSGSIEAVYNELVGANPVNPAAGSAGMKLVDPGYPARSFLFAKVAGDIDENIDYTTVAMGGDMPQNQPQLPYEDIELIRQWILYGADTVSEYVDPQILDDYYNGTMGMARLQPLTPPDPSEGFQIHYGPFFLNPLEEVEYFYKYDTRLVEASEVDRVNIVINDFSHHTALYRYFPEADTNFAPGLRPVNSIVDAAGVYYTSDIIGQWPNSQDLVLPEGAAFFWNANAVVDLNYHLPNYSTDSILAGEFYMNVYTNPSGTAQQEMKSFPVYYGGQDPTALVLPPGIVDSVYTINQFESSNAPTWYIWSMMAHTHQLGSDYQVWLRNPDGSKGENVYNGHYDATYNFDQGFYDWEHPPFRTFDDELLEVDFSTGLIHEATFSNPSNETVWFGLTTTDEMYVTYLQYVEEPLLGINDREGAALNPLKVYPNPTNDAINLAFDINSGDDCQITIVNELGQQVFTRTLRSTSERTRVSLSKSELGLSNGIYFVQVNSENLALSAKVLLTE